MKSLIKRSNFGLRPNFFEEDAFAGIFELSVDRALEDIFDSTVRTRVNVFSTETGSVIEIEAPGMSKTDFMIKVDGSSLMISGQFERRNDVSEFRKRSFSRTFTLPEGARPTEIKASYEAGILRVDIPSIVSEKKMLTIDVT